MLAAPCRKARSGAANSSSDRLFDLKYAERLAVALQDDVHGAADTILQQKLRGTKPLLVFEMIGNDGFSSPQREAGWRSEIGSDFCDSDNARTPADAGPDEKAILRRHVLQDLAKFSLDALGGQTRGVA